MEKTYLLKQLEMALEWKKQDKAKLEKTGNYTTSRMEQLRREIKTMEESIDDYRKSLE